MPPIPDIPYSQAVAGRGKCFHKANTSAQADIYDYVWEGKPAVLKDFNKRPAILRRIWTIPICAREVRALSRLRDLPGIPMLYATAGPCAFIMERIEGVRMPRRRETPPSPEFWASARKLVDALHREGISHGDLRRKNILMGPDGQAYLIDFATAARDRRGNVEDWFSRKWFRFARRIDRVTFARIKASYPSATLDATELAWLADDPWHLRLGRFLKQNIYRLRKPKVIRKRLRRLVKRLQGKPVGVRRRNKK